MIASESQLQPRGREGEKMINEEEYDKEVLKELLAFDDTSKQPSRIKCATLSANGIKDYLEKENHS